MLLSGSRRVRVSLVASISCASLPERPTARPPTAWIALTICLLMLPASTISTISTVAEVGDPEALDELALDLEAVEHRLDLRAAAVHHDRVDADLLEQHDVAREGLAELGRAHRVAAVLDDEGRAGEAPHVGQRLDQRRRDLMVERRGPEIAHRAASAASAASAPRSSAMPLPSRALVAIGRGWAPGLRASSAATVASRSGTSPARS